METFSETKLFSIRVKAIFYSLVKVVAGSLFITLCMNVKVPFFPVPMTLQTFGVFVLATTLGARHSFLALLFYLFQATVGLPVTTQGACPLWLFGPTGGYLLSFPLAAYLIGALAQKKRDSFLRVALAISLGQILIYGMGSLFLSRLIGFKKAIICGVLPFIPSAALKLLVAASLRKAHFYLLRLFARI